MYKEKIFYMVKQEKKWEFLILLKNILKMNKQRRTEIAKKAIETQRKRKTGWFKKSSQEKAAKWRKENNAGFYNKEKAKLAGRKGVKTQIKNKIGFHSKKTQLKAAKLGFESMCKNKNIKYFNEYFMSKRECEISMCLYNQYKIIPIKNKSFHLDILLFIKKIMFSLKSFSFNRNISIDG